MVEWEIESVLEKPLTHPDLRVHERIREFNETRSPLVRDLVRYPLKLEDGHLRVPAGPGLGVEVDEAAVTRYRVA